GRSASPSTRAGTPTRSSSCRATARRRCSPPRRRPSRPSRRRRSHRSPRSSAPLRASRPNASGAASGGVRGRMAEPDSAAAVAADDRESRDVLAQLVLAAIGAVALTAERIEELVDSLVERGGIQRDEARAAVDDLASRWRGDATRMTERAGAGVHGLLRELGLVLRSECEELELRLSQVEHRLRLLEKARDATTVPTPQ